MHGKKDNIVPQIMGLELFEKANDPKFSYFPDNDDHMMEYNEELLSKIKNFNTNSKSITKTFVIVWTNSKQFKEVSTFRGVSIF